MARLARVVIPEIPHHVTQRGVRRQQTFFSDADYLAYLHLAAEAFHEAGVQVWAYCLTPIAGLLGQQIAIVLLVAVLKEDRLSPVSALGHVVRQAGKDEASEAGHGWNTTRTGGAAISIASTYSTCSSEILSADQQVDIRPIGSLIN
jgi:hypothetical protein